MSDKRTKRPRSIVAAIEKYAVAAHNYGWILNHGDVDLIDRALAIDNEQLDKLWRAIEREIKKAWSKP